MDDVDDTTGSVRLGSTIRVFRLVDAACAVLLLGTIVHAVVTGADLLTPIPPRASFSRAVRFLALYALPGAIGAVTVALGVFVCFPGHRPRRLAVAAMGVALAGFVLLGCVVSTPWAFQQGLGAVLPGVVLIGGGVAAHVWLARLCWHAGEEP